MLAGGRQRGQRVRPTGRDLAQRVDRRRAQICVGMTAEELERSWHEQVIGRSAVTLLARVAGERVERPGPHGEVVVVERGNEVGNGLLVDELIEDADAETADDRLRMPEPAAQRRQRGRARNQEMALGLLAGVRDGELRHPPVEVVAGR